MFSCGGVRRPHRSKSLSQSCHASCLTKAVKVSSGQVTCIASRSFAASSDFGACKLRHNCLDGPKSSALMSTTAPPKPASSITSRSCVCEGTPQETRRHDTQIFTRGFLSDETEKRMPSIQRTCGWHHLAVNKPPRKTLSVTQ